MNSKNGIKRSFLVINGEIGKIRVKSGNFWF